MQTIHESPELIQKILGKQKRKEDQYPIRLLTYVIQQPVDDGLLLYNTLTLCLIWLNKEEAQHITEIEELFDLWFLVPQDHNDEKLCKQLKSMAMLFEKKNTGMDNFVILPTSDCNARCFYCFEKNAAHIHMSKETAERVAQFIAIQNKDKIKIQWFGGEPLYNIPPIDIITQQLKDNGIEYSSTMVSNGYLFDDNIIQRAKELWNLKKVQITLDGTEEIYNRSKRYIYKEGSAYQRVLENIGKLTAAEIKVSIRLNVDKHNIDNMFILVRELHERFGESKFLTIYSHVLFENVDNHAKRTQEERDELYRRRMELEELIKDCHYHAKAKLPWKLELNHCIADSDNSIVIAPKGDLGKCEHYVDCEFIGNIGSNERNLQVMRKYKEHYENPMCCYCIYFPQCTRLKNCPDMTECTPDILKQYLHNRIEGMQEEFKNFNENKQKH